MLIWIYLIVFGSFISKPCLFYDVQNEAAGSTDLSKQISPDNLLLFSTLDGTLTAIDKNDGKVRWKHQDEPAVKVPIDTKQAINPIVLPDPKDGSLYLLGGAKTDSLKKLPFTIPELVASAPCRSSDGIFYTGKKTDQWFLVEPRTGQREPVLGWNSNPVDPNTCPLVPGSGVYIGRTQYEILMLDINNESKRKWNVTFFGYAADPMSSDMRLNYDMIHFSTSSTGLLITMDRISGKMLWKLDLGSPVVAVYLLTSSGLVSVPFTSVSHQTLPMLEKANPYSHKMRLYPTLYIGEHIHGLYALPSLVDQTAVTITASQTSPLLLEGPSTPNENQKNDDKFSISGQNIRILPDDLDKLYDSPNLRHIFMDKNLKIYLGHYNVPEFSSVQLRLSGRQFDGKVLKPPALDSENESNVNIIKTTSEKRSVEVQTDGTDDTTENLKYSTTYILSYYWYAKTWLNKQENIGLKIALIIVVGCMISMFWYFKAQVREFQQMSQGSTGSAHSLNSPVTAYLEELNDGQLRIGKITFRPDVVLGRGCEGTCVYRGEFEGRAVAVKRILPEYFSLADREVSLLKESDAHPHVIRYHCTERDRQFRYIALELCVATLYDYVLKKDQIVQVLPKISEMDILKQATSGIAYLHSLDIVHRDIKPQNVLLWVGGPGGTEVRALISDFGLCKKLQIGRTSFSRRSGITGTDGWIAPEMLNGNFKTTTAVDMFSLGCVFYFVLSAGKHPFGEPLRRQGNILSDLYVLNDLLGPDNTRELAKNLIISLIVSIPSERPPAESVLKHPLFWNKPKTLTFFQDVSDRVEKADNFDGALLSLEKYSNSVVKSDWRMHVSDAVALDLRRFRTYRGESVRDLLRALRNKKHHYHELPKEAQEELGEIPDSFIDYWTLRFPQLLLHTWLAMQCVKHEPSFLQYYHKHFVFPNNLCKNLLIDDNQDEITFYLENISRKKPIDNLKNKSKKLLIDVPIKNVECTTKIDTKDKLKNLNYDWRQTINDSNSFETKAENVAPYRRRTNNHRSRKMRKSIGESSPIWKLSNNQES